MSQVAIIGGPLNNGRVLTETQQSKENATVSAFGIPLSANLTVLKEFRYNEASIKTELNSTSSGSGLVHLADSSSLELRTGAATSSWAQSKSKKVHRYVSGVGNRGQWSIILGDTGVAGNIREWGYKSADDQNGAFFRLNGTTLYFVLLNGGSETTVESSTWDLPPVLNANGNLWYIQYEWQGVGDFFLYYQQKLVHTHKFQGTSLTASMEDPDLPFHFRNENTTNATDVILKNPCSVMMYEGNESVQIRDQNDNILRFTEDQRIRTQAFGTSLMSENFADDVFDTTNRWGETIDGGANKTITNSILSLSVTTANADKIREVYNTPLQESVGATALASFKYSFGSPLETGNIREWGFFDAAENNGIFFRLNGSVFSVIFLKGGVEQVEDLGSILPDQGFHRYTLSLEDVDNFRASIDGTTVFSSTGTILVGNKIKKPFTQNYNAALLAGVPSPSQISSITLIDSSGQSTVIVGKDSSGVPREAAFDQSGNLKTVAVITTPPETLAVSVIEKGSMSGTNDFFYTITNGSILTLQRVSGGAETSNSGHIIELYEDATGTGTPLVPIDDIYVNGSSDQKDLSISYVGDGIRRILLRRKAFGGGANEVTGRWEGYEQ